MIIVILLSIVILCLICMILFNSKSSKNEIIRILVRQTARWAIASLQDENAMIAVLHANYSAGYLWALRDIATDNEIYKATRIDILKLRDEVVGVQDNATIKMARACPKFVPEPSYLTQVSRLTE